MAKRILSATGLALAALAVLVACNSRRADLTAPPPDAIRVATHNVHYIVLGQETGRWSRGDWEARKPALNAAFQALGADIVAFQEMESFQRGGDGLVNLARDWLIANNPGYAAGATGDWRSFPSTQPIFYRTERFALVDQGWFFFSRTPDVIYSRTFNGSWPAFASWVRLRDDAGDLRVVNLHFEYKSASNRRLSADLVAERIAPWIAAGERVLVVGDLNVRHGGGPMRTLEAAGVTFAPVAGSTYHFDRGIGLFGAIDHLGHSAGLRQVGETQVLRQKFDGRWPSDHWPVVGDFVRVP